MSEQDLLEQVVDSWRIHNRINLYLLQQIGEKGLDCIPAASRGRNVAQQFVHMHKVRVAWIRYNSADLVSRVPQFEKGASPSRAKLKSALRASGKAVEALLERTLRGGGRIKAFKQEPVRWMAYLIAHESHHRGQIALALKQSGMRLPEKVAIRGLWEQWYWGKK